MTQQIMETNRALLLSITDIHAHLDADSTLHLYTNDHTPAPEDDAADFTEGAWDTYAEADLTADWSEPVKDIEGRYSTRTDKHTFLAPTTGSATVYGCYVRDDTEVVLAARFPAPLVLGDGGEDEIRVRVIYQRWAGLTLLEVEGGD